MSLPPSESPDDASRISRVVSHAAIWTLVCAFAAAPSFMHALKHGFDPAGMVVGVVLFIAAYTAFSCRDKFIRRWAIDPGFRVTLYVGYGLRIALAVPPFGFLADMFPGMISVGLVARLGLPQHGFLSALLTTVVQGALLSGIVAFLMFILYQFVRTSFKPAAQPRGFAVLPVAQQAEPASGRPARRSFDPAVIPSEHD